MKILITSGIFPPDIGGPASYVPKIANYLSQHGHEVTVLCLSDQLNLSDLEYNFKVIRIHRNIFLPWRLLKTIFLITRLAFKNQLIFANTLALESFFASKLSGRPIIHKVVGDYAWEKALARKWVACGIHDFYKENSFKIRLLKWYCYLPFKYANRILVPSHFTKRNMGIWGISASLIQVIHNGIHFVDVSHPKEKNTLITVGRLIPLKRMDATIRSLVKLPNKKLKIIGDGPEKNNLHQLVATLQLTNRVEFLGRLSNADTIQAIASAEILILNSSGENFPHVILEAMMVNTFVIANDVGGCREAVHHLETGFLMNSANGGIQEGVDFFNKSLQKTNILHKAYKKVKQTLNEAIMLDKTKQALQDLKADAFFLPIKEDKLLSAK